MMWIEDIVESTLALPFLTYSRVDMVGFMDLHNQAVVKKNAFSTLPSARNRGESKGGVESGRLKCRFHKWKGIWIYKRSLKLVPIPKNRTPMKNVVMVKDKYEEGEKTKNNWVDGEILHLIFSHVNHTFLMLDPKLLTTFIVP